MIHDICEAYPGLRPDDVGAMTIDQIYTLAWSRKRLLIETGDRVEGSPEELKKLGVINEQNYSSGKSIAGLLNEKEELLMKIDQLEEARKVSSGRQRRSYRRSIKALKKQIQEIERELSE